MTDHSSGTPVRLVVRENGLGGLECLLNGVDLAPHMLSEGLSVKSAWSGGRAELHATLTVVVDELDIDALVNLEEVGEPANG